MGNVSDESPSYFCPYFLVNSPHLPIFEPMMTHDDLNFFAEIDRHSSGIYVLNQRLTHPFRQRNPRRRPDSAPEGRGDPARRHP